MGCLGRAIQASQANLSAVLNKAKFWEGFARVPLNERQHTMINRLLDDFRGKLTTSKWATLAKCSQDTALRDITDLVNRGILVRSKEGGRSTSYGLIGNEPDQGGP